MEIFTYTIKPGEEHLSAKELLRRRLNFSSRLVRNLKNNGAVLKNGEPIRLYMTGNAGDVLTVQLPEERSEFIPMDIPLDIIYEDESLLVFNKQPGIVVHPTHGHPVGTMANAIMKYMNDTDQSFKIRFVNRIDMGTSGLVMAAKNSHSQDNMMKQMKEGSVVKTYLAVVKGIILPEEGTVDLPIDREAEDSVKRAVRPDGYPSITHYRVLERFRTGHTLLELKLETGRTHQIRVHMAYIGHPLVGDSLYNESETPGEGFIERQALHALKMEFRHPATGAFMELEAPLPEDFNKMTDMMRASKGGI